eukprot:TRINITY_DN1982_c0_g4_i1.p1 TRINITY_DN1982_c0_g4~~TRINITY_DN1982_c0_g4_i1.p1  ORF type:complete len:352 (+),score=73.23 TRINITY_DN1982_c0_g4_i1:674-1729(+)
MNFIVVHLLKHLTEEEAFWTLNSLVESFLPIDYYANMAGILVDQKVFSLLLQANIPDFWEHLRKMRVDPSLVSLQWFISCFSHSLCPDVAERIWDYFFLHGPKILFRAGLALISLTKNDFLTCKSAQKSSFVLTQVEDVLFLIERNPRNFQDVEALSQTIFLDKFKVLSNRRISELRKEARKELVEGACRERAKMRKSGGKLRYVALLPLNPARVKVGLAEIAQYECNEEWPVCAFDHTLKAKSHMSHQCQSKMGKEWIDDYFDAPLKRSSEISNCTSPDMLLIERNRHICKNKPFVEKVNKLLLLDDPCTEAFPLDLIELTIDGKLNTCNIMEEYIEHVLVYRIPVLDNK